MARLSHNTHMYLLRKSTTLCYNFITSHDRCQICTDLRMQNDHLLIYQYQRHELCIILVLLYVSMCIITDNAHSLHVKLILFRTSLKEKEIGSPSYLTCTLPPMFAAAASLPELNFAW